MHPSHQPQPPALPYPLPPGHPTANDYGPPVDAPHRPATQSFPAFTTTPEPPRCSPQCTPMTPCAAHPATWGHASAAFTHPQAGYIAPPHSDAHCCQPGAARTHDGWTHGGWAHGGPSAHAHDAARSPRHRTTAGVLQIIGGWAGIGRFYAGDPRRGGIHLALFSSGMIVPQLGLLSVAMIGYGIIDGIQILKVNTRDSEGRLLSE